jgi:DNA-binding NtrC family response regulator
MASGRQIRARQIPNPYFRRKMDPILVVDDEIEMRIAMSETLKHCGYGVELSDSANDALEKIKKDSYSLVVADMTMPERSGLELLKDIKSVKPALPVIMVTAYGTVQTAVEAMRLGAFDYVLKPFNFDIFAFVVERALEFKDHAGNGSAHPELKEEQNYYRLIPCWHCDYKEIDIFSHPACRGCGWVLCPSCKACKAGGDCELNPLT